MHELYQLYRSSHGSIMEYVNPPGGWNLHDDWGHDEVTYEARGLQYQINFRRRGGQSVPDAQWKWIYLLKFGVFFFGKYTIHWVFRGEDGGQTEGLGVNSLKIQLQQV